MHAHPKTIALTGASGFLGRKVYAALSSRGDEVVVLTRDARRTKHLFPAAKAVLDWSPSHEGAWVEAIASADAVVHLAGESIAGKRWNSRVKERILRSRVEGTRSVVEAALSDSRVSVLLSASGIGYYGLGDENEIPEDAPPGNDFLARVCIAWEAEANRATERRIRVVTPRFGMILDAHGGALPRLAAPFRFFAGGPIGSGRQWMPWIHVDDAVRVILFAIDEVSLRGGFAADAPHTVRNREFAALLARRLHRPALLPVPPFALRVLVGEFAESLLRGQRVYPRRLENAGFTYLFPDLESALADLYPHARA
ncbi:MAG: TIGR01777 family oxidoreductase [Bacteroidota bacterium]|nr:TIGR01777 family oxidoreductase [Bacteroidota bacterium]